ncbi:MAG: hypothetical protein RLZZ292_691 [Bacteroidota bacterium]|jgi:hypothetical protein
MKQFLFPIAFLGWVILSLSACFTPQSVVRVNPMYAPSKWSNGEQVLSQTKDSVECNAYFVQYTKDFLIFDVEFINLSRKTILVTPETFFYLSDSTLTDYPFAAINPEKQLLDMELAQSRADARFKNLALWGGVAIVAATAVTVASSSGSGHSDNHTHYPRYPTPIYIPSSNYPNPNLPSPYEMAFWDRLTLRKTTLADGYAIKGKVVFSRKDHHPNLFCHFLTDNRDFSMPFRQVVYKPK